MPGDFDDLRIRELLFFDRLVHLGTITATAKELGLPKPTASRWLAALEDHVGSPLVIRGARRIALTEQGKAFHQLIGPLLRSARAAREALAADLAGGTVRVSVPVPFGRLVGGAVIAAFARRFPGVRLEVSLENAHVDLLRDRVDLALRGGPLPDSDLVARQLATVPLCLYRSATISADDPAARVLIAAPGDEVLLRDLQPDLLPAAAIVDDRAAVRDALCSGAGTGLLPTFLGEPARESGELVRLDKAPLSAIRMHAVFLPERRSAPRIRALIDIIEAHVQGWSALG